MKSCFKLSSIALACMFASSTMATVNHIQIQATENTDYGNDAVATMLSTIQTAEDGLATYQIAFDVKPPAGKNIRSRSSSGTSTTFSWGVGADGVFKGSDAEYAEMDNLRIVNFAANGGAVTLDDFKGLSFTNITFVNAHNAGKDAVKITTNNTTSNDLGVVSETVNVESLDGVIPSVKHIKLEAGERDNQVTNKWSVDSVEVSVTGNALAGRADWLRGSWGLNWKPTDTYNGRAETLTIDLFIDSISHLKTIDYLQLHLNESYINSPSHLGPHELLESLWQGDTDAEGQPINLVVPRAAADVDPFLDMIKATQNAGLKVQVYVNSSNMLERGADIPNPDHMPNITARWKAHCDSDPEIQAFINSQEYHTDENHPDRKYMFAYAEFVLKTYAKRYGKLIDGWLFDSGTFMEQNGDNAINGVIADQQIYKAFADAVHAGNPMAAVSFNNGPERETESLNPFSEATRYDDFMFGHPYNGGRYLGNHDNGIYERNYAHIEKITATNGNVHSGIDPNDWEWDDKVVGHFDPPMSRTRWNSGADPGLTDEEFVQWNLESAIGGGAISWGAPLLSPPGSGEQHTIQPWGMAQLELMDASLAELQQPGAPNWARAHTVLSNAVFGQTYTRTLTEGVDFWDPEGDAVSLRLLDVAGGAPAWLTLVESETNLGTWILQGTPTENQETSYHFRIQAQDATGASERWVTLTVAGEPSVYPFKASTQIFATPNTDYGINNIATMISATQTAPNGLATFQIAFDASPAPGAKIQSGTSGGLSTDTSWGIGADKLFKGSDNESADSIANLRVINFHANGSNMQESDITELSFSNVEIVNGQSSHDRVLTTANGVINAASGEKMSGTPAQLDLNYASFDPITNLAIGVGTATDQTKNKWSVNNLGITYTIIEPTEVTNIIGDIDGDGVLGASDMMVYRTALGSTEGDDAYVLAADLDNDGVISRIDYSMWYRLYRNQ